MKAPSPAGSWSAAILLFTAGAALAAEPAAPPTIDRVVCSEITELAEGVAAECGFLRVPENREKEDSRAIRIPFVRFISGADAPGDPILFLAGGPGARTIKPRTGTRMPVLGNRDFIMLEQRGVGLSQPALECPEYAAAKSSSPEAASLIDAAMRCAERARAEGADLAGYASREIVKDIEDLRRALGIDRFNLYGLSYSGRVMTAYARDHPARTGAIVLNSPLPVEANYDEQTSVGLLRTLDLIFNTCEADDACAAAYPKLRARFATLAKRDPVAAGALLSSLADAGHVAQFPSYVERLERGDRELLSSLFSGPPPFAWLMRIAVWCNEEYPFEDEAAIEAQRTGFPEIGAADRSTVPPGLCAALGLPEHMPPPSENQPVATAAPILILVGELDPLTPVPWMQAMLAHMPNGRLVIVPGATHAAGFAECPWRIAEHFLDAPEEPLTDECLTSAPGAAFSAR